MLLVELVVVAFPICFISGMPSGFCCPQEKKTLRKLLENSVSAYLKKSSKMGGRFEDDCDRTAMHMKFSHVPTICNSPYSNDRGYPQLRVLSEQPLIFVIQLVLLKIYTLKKSLFTEHSSMVALLPSMWLFLEPIPCCVVLIYTRAPLYNS